jgi:type I restriction-modification system DNA methylase subunit
MNTHETRTLILVAEGELFRMVGAEAVVRRHLIESERLTAVLGVPPGLFYSSTMVKLGLLVIAEKPLKRSTVRFVDISHKGLSYRGTRGRFEFDFDPQTETAELISGQAPADKTMGRDVSYDEIFEHNFVLTPDRYLNAGLRDRIDMLMRDADAATLPDVAELIRPANLQKSLGEDYTIFEASPGDIGDRGYLDQPGRSFTVDRATYTRALNQRVQPGDVLLSIKGTIGVVGLVPENVPHEGETAIWTAGQSLMILRPKKRGGMDPITLYEYLTDETVNEFIKSLAGGSVIQNLGMKDLKAFPVPVPSKQIMQDVRARFMARQALLDEVEAIHRRIAAERAEQWPHAQLART